MRNEYGFGNVTTVNKIIGNLIRRDRVAHFEMIMGLDMKNVMDNNWILFCIWRVQLPFLWLSSQLLTATSMHIKPHLLNARARGLHCVYVSLV